MENEGRALDPADFGALLRHYRLTAGLTQEALAERARVSLDGISALERGYRRSPQRETLALLAGALALSDDQRRAFEAAAAPPASPRHRQRASVTVGPWADSAFASLPLALSSFVGRDREVAEIGKLVRGNRMVTLTGAGGVGKTQTALHVATALNESGHDAACFVALAPLDNPLLVAAAIASTVRVQEVSDRPLLETLVAYFKNKALLLILDNCEHVITQAAIVADALLSACPRVRILATSRESLRAAGEYNYRLPTLSFPSPEVAGEIRATDASTYGAIVLFTDRAGAADQRFALTDENAPAVAEICRRLDGIPLAIELAAARVNQFSLKVIAEKLDDRFRILTGGLRTALPRQQTMRATIDWSYDLLSAPERQVFERLSAFAGGCTLDAATTVCGGDEASRDDVFELLSSLIEKSLLVVDLERHEPRYRLLESFRQYARERLVIRGEDRIIANRHALAYTEAAERLGPMRDSVPHEVWMAQPREELDNWRAAVQWSLIDGADVPLGQRLVGELVCLWGGGNFSDASRWVSAALEVADEQTPAKVLARLRLAGAIVAKHLGNHRVQLTSGEMAVALYRQIGDLKGLAHAQETVGNALLALGRVAEAIAILTEALIGERKFGSPGDTAQVLRNLASACRQRGDFTAAHAYYAEAIPLLEAADEKGNLAYTKLDLAELALAEGNPELALRHGTEMLAVAGDVELNARCTIYALTSMSTSLIALGRYDEGKGCARQAVGFAREQRFEVPAAYALQNLAMAVALRAQSDARIAPGEYEKAARILGFVDARLVERGARREATDQSYDRLLAVLRNAIGADCVERFMTEGAMATEEVLIAEATAD
jgi:predicted ATPase/DNA-binding XRE family transcriptional regulator